MATSPPPPSSCPCCENVGTKLCTGCKDVRYCGAECQKKDWKIHKHLCKSVANFADRPKEGMRRVVYFPPDSDKPLLKWAKVVDHSSFETVEVDGVDPESLDTSLSIPLNVRNGRPLEGYIRLEHDDLFESKYTDLNPALVTATNGRLKNSWKGPLVAYTGINDHRGDTISVQDFTMDQYSALIVFMVALNEHSSDYLWGVYRQMMAPKIQAVKIIGALERLPGRSIFQVAEVTEEHPAYSAKLGRFANIFRARGESGQFSPISERIGMPLIAWRYPQQGTPNLRGAPSNDEVTAMFINIQEDSDSFGFPPNSWNGDQVSDVILTRSDYRGLEIKTAAAFAAFCRYHVLPFVERALLKGSGTKKHVRRALEEITPEKWALYQEQWQKLQAKSAEVTDTMVAGKPRMGLTSADYRSVVARFLA